MSANPSPTWPRRAGTWTALPVCAAMAMTAGCGPANGPGAVGGHGGASTNGVDTNGDGDVPAPPDELAPIRSARLAAVDDYAYVLQGDPVLDLASIAESDFDLVVIDYSEDGSADGEFSRQDIAALKAGGQRIVLAYMSIGEAEVGRFYFDNAWVEPDPEVDSNGPFELTDEAPDFLAPPNPLFPDNFKVRYWDPVWQEIIVTNPGGNPYIGDQDSYLDRIVDLGFDGVYLDIIDAYEYFGPAEINAGGPEERRDAAVLMIELVEAIKQHAEAVAGGEFFVFPQNGAGLIDPQSYPDDIVPTGQTQQAYAAQMTDRYFAAIDGLGAEDTFYFGDDDEDNPFNPQTYVINLLDECRAAGLLVLAIDYLTDDEAIDDFYTRCRDRGWVPYAALRDLAELSTP